MRKLALLLVLVLIGGWYALAWNQRPPEIVPGPASTAEAAVEPAAAAESPPETTLPEAAVRSELANAEPKAGSTIELKILRFGSDEPVADAQVFYLTNENRWENLGDEQRALWQSDADEFYRRHGRKMRSDARGIAQVPLGRAWYRVFVIDGDSYGEARPDRNKSWPGPQVVYLRPDRTLTISVLDAVGHPAGGVEVVARPRAEDPFEGEPRWNGDLGKTNAVGQVVVRHSQTLAGTNAKCRVDLLALPVGGESNRVPTELSEPPSHAVALRLPPTGSVDFRIVLPSGAAYAPEVLDDKWLSVEVFDSKQAWARRESVHDVRPKIEADGTIFLPHVCIEKFLSAFVDRDKQKHAVFPGPTAQGERKTVTIRLSAEPVIFVGRALDAEHLPIADHRIDLTFRSDQEFGSPTALTDASGNFRLHSPWIDPGQKVRLFVHAYGRSSDDRRLARVPGDWTVIPGQNLLGDLAFGEDPLLLTGRVVFPDNTKDRELDWVVEGMLTGWQEWHQVGSVRTVWQGDGRFELHGPVVADSRLRLKYFRDRFGTMEPFEFRAGAKDAEIKVQTS